MVKILFIVLFIFSFMSYSQESELQIFNLKNGSKVSGEVLSYDSETTSYLVKTSVGVITININDLQVNDIIVWLINGDRYVGELIMETDTFVKIKTNYGVLDIDQTQIKRLEFKSIKNTFDVKELERVGDIQDRYFYGNEKLIDIYFDPTGFTLDKNVLYISGLSIGYGISDRLQFTTKYWETIASGSLNARIKYKLFEKGDLKKKNAFSIGTHFHLASYPSKYYTAKDDSGDDIRLRVGQTDEDSPATRKSWAEFFMAHTTSSLKKSEKGRYGWTNGLSVTSYPDFELLLRLYSAIDIDIRDDLKFLFEIFYDPYWQNSFDTQAMFDELNINIDYGIIYNVNDNLRFGIHYQRPFFAFYYKY